MAVPAWLQALSQQQAQSSGGIDGTVGTNSTGATTYSQTGSGGALSSPDQGISDDDARRQLMNGSPSDPDTWVAYQKVYGRPHTNSPEGQALIQQEGSPAAVQQANAQTYTGFQDDPGGNFYPGQETIDRAAAIEGVNMQDLVNNPAANQQITYSGADPGQDITGQPYNQNQYASPESAQWLAQQLGGEYVPAESYEGGQAGTMPGAAYIKMPDGTMMNAGLVGRQYERVQGEYQQQMRNYEMNLSQNPNIVGTGFLSQPGNPIEMLQNRLAGNPLSNTNAAGGNQGIRDALAQGQNAFGQPLGEGGRFADYPNAPVDDLLNPIDQSNLPGDQPGPGPPPPGGITPPGGTPPPPPGDTPVGIDPPGGPGLLEGPPPPGGGPPPPPGGFGGPPGGGPPPPPGGTPPPGGGPPPLNQWNNLFDPQTGQFNAPPGFNPWDNPSGQGGMQLQNLMQMIQTLRGGPQGGGQGGGQGGMMGGLPGGMQQAQNQNYYGQSNTQGNPEPGRNVNEMNQGAPPPPADPGGLMGPAVLPTPGGAPEFPGELNQGAPQPPPDSLLNGPGTPPTPIGAPQPPIGAPQPPGSGWQGIPAGVDPNQRMTQEEASAAGVTYAGGSGTPPTWGEMERMQNHDSSQGVSVGSGPGDPPNMTPGAPGSSTAPRPPHTDAQYPGQPTPGGGLGATDSGYNVMPGAGQGGTEADAAVGPIGPGDPYFESISKPWQPKQQPSLAPKTSNYTNQQTSGGTQPPTSGVFNNPGFTSPYGGMNTAVDPINYGQPQQGGLMSPPIGQTTRPIQQMNQAPLNFQPTMTSGRDTPVDMITGNV